MSTKSKVTWQVVSPLMVTDKSDVYEAPPAKPVYDLVGEKLVMVVPWLHDAVKDPVTVAIMKLPLSMMAFTNTVSVPKEF